MKTILFIESKNQADHTKELLKNKPGGLAVATSEKIAYYCSENKINCRWLGEYTHAARIVEIEKCSWDFADSWHADPWIWANLNYRGIPLGDSIRLYMGLHLLWILKCLTRIEACLCEEKPDKVLVFEEEGHSQGQAFFPDEEEPVCARVCDFLGTKTLVTRIPSSARNSKPSGWFENFKQKVRSLTCLAYEAVTPDTPSLLQKPVVLVSSALQHVENVINPLGKCEVLYLDESFRVAKVAPLMRNHVRYFSYSTRKKLTHQRREQRLEFTRDIFMKNEKLLGHLSNRRLFSFECHDVTLLLKERLTYFFKSWIPEIAESIDFFYFFLKRHNVKVVLVDEDTVTFHKALVGVANLCGIATVQIPHSANYENTQYDLLPVLAQFICVAGEGAKRFYETNGVNSARVVVTGAPRYDHFNISMNSKESVGIFKVLLANTTLFDAMESRRTRREQMAALQDLAECLKEIPEAFLWVCPHPLDTQKTWTLDVFRKADYARFRIMEKTSFRQLLMASDVVVSFPSNAVTESLMMAKPTIVLDYFQANEWKVPYFHEKGREICVNSSATLRTGLRRVFAADASIPSKSKERQEWIFKNWLMPIDDNAGLRCAELILRLAQGSKVEKEVAA